MRCVTLAPPDQATSRRSDIKQYIGTRVRAFGPPSNFLKPSPCRVSVKNRQNKNMTSKKNRKKAVIAELRTVLESAIDQIRVEVFKTALSNLNTLPLEQPQLGVYSTEEAINQFTKPMAEYANIVADSATTSAIQFILRNPYFYPLVVDVRESHKASKRQAQRTTRNGGAKARVLWRISVREMLARNRRVDPRNKVPSEALLERLQGLKVVSIDQDLVSLLDEYGSQIEDDGEAATIKKDVFLRMISKEKSKFYFNFNKLK